jgi:hypothetical protein
MTAASPSSLPSSSSPSLPQSIAHHPPSMHRRRQWQRR